MKNDPPWHTLRKTTCLVTQSRAFQVMARCETSGTCLAQARGPCKNESGRVLGHWWFCVLADLPSNDGPTQRPDAARLGPEFLGAQLSRVELAGRCEDAGFLSQRHSGHSVRLKVQGLRDRRVASMAGRDESAFGRKCPQRLSFGNQADGPREEQHFASRKIT